VRQEDKIRMMRMASHGIELPPEKHILERACAWLFLAIFFVLVILFIRDAHAESLTIFGGPQVPVEGWKLEIPMSSSRPDSLTRSSKMGQLPMSSHWT